MTDLPEVPKYSMAGLIQLAWTIAGLSYKRETPPGDIQSVLAELKLLTKVLGSVSDIEIANPGSLSYIQESIRACSDDMERLHQKLCDIAPRSSFLVKLKWNKKTSLKHIVVLQRHREVFTHALSNLQL